jgi:hypothetical protein
VTRRVVYLAHQLSGTEAEMRANRAFASRWAAFLAVNFEVAVECSWIVLSSQWDETPENRARGLACDLALVERCDELVMVGPRISGGMRLEAGHAASKGLPVVDLTQLPMDPQAVALRWARIRGLVT